MTTAGPPQGIGTTPELGGSFPPPGQSPGRVRDWPELPPEITPDCTEEPDPRRVSATVTPLFAGSMTQNLGVHTMGNISRLRGATCVIHHDAFRAEAMLARKAANWNSRAEFIASHLQEQLCEVVGLRHALRFVPLAYANGVAHALCPVCFLHGRGQQRIEAYLPEDGDLDGQEWFRCACCTETFAIAQTASVAAPVTFPELELPARTSRTS